MMMAKIIMMLITADRRQLKAIYHFVKGYLGK